MRAEVAADGSNFEIQRKGVVAVVTFVRPPINSMDVASLHDLRGILEELAGDESVRAVVLTGGIDGYFIAHADLEEFEHWRGQPSAAAVLSAWDNVASLLESIPQPTIAAIDGQAWGGGCELALACTFRVCTERAHLALPEVTVGVIPGGGGTQRLPRLVPVGLATELVLSGKSIKAEAALTSGLVNAVLPSEDFVDSVVCWSGRFTRHPRGVVASAKRAITEGLRVPLVDGLAIERRIFNTLMDGAESVD